MKLKNVTATLLSFICFYTSAAQNQQIKITNDNEGYNLLVGEKKYFIKGVNWDYIPVGKNYEFNLWNESDEFVKQALHREMTMLQKMGVNTIRVYSGIPSRWITYIHDVYGIYTMLNHSFGRYGLMIDNSWVTKTDYSDSRMRSILLDEVSMLAEEFKDTRGLLLYLLGNENNYGLFWEGSATENVPVGLDSFAVENHARSMYNLFNQAALKIKLIDTNRPVAICNGGSQFISLIAQECGDVDIIGANVYTGFSFGKFFEELKREVNKPVIMTEFGSDAFNALTGVEDQMAQAKYIVNNWKEIYLNAGGLGNAQNTLGGFTFQWSDGWWKHGQTKGLETHDTNASWSNGGYSFDYELGMNNMNEEWFGICGKRPTELENIYELIPRASYFALKKVHKLNPLDPEMSIEEVIKYFKSINLENAQNRANER